MTPRKAGSESRSTRDEKAADGLAGSRESGEGSATGAASNTRADNSTAPPPCEACGHPQRASRREVEWTHSFNLHDEIRALAEERDGYKLAALSKIEALNLAIKDRDGLRAALATAHSCGRLCSEHQEVVRSALDGEGK